VGLLQNTLLSVSYYYPHARRYARPADAARTQRVATMQAMAKRVVSLRPISRRSA
jgi:hypothetical protein